MSTPTFALASPPLPFPLSQFLSLLFLSNSYFLFFSHFVFFFSFALPFLFSLLVSLDSLFLSCPLGFLSFSSSFLFLPHSLLLPLLSISFSFFSSFLSLSFSLSLSFFLSVIVNLSLSFHPLQCSPSRAYL